MICMYMLDCVTVKMFYRRGKRTNIVCIPMRKCVINRENPALQRLTSNTATVNQCVSSSPSSLSEGHYNTLQFNYDTGYNLPPKAYASFPTTPLEDLSSAQHENHDSNPSTLSNNFQMLLDHSTSPINHNTSNIAMLQANGYVLPDDFGKQSHKSATRSIFTDESQKKSADKEFKAVHDTAFVLKPDGTGIIRTGTLQVTIPPSKKDEDYRVTPSQTHESYFDIVKNT